jgi:hypothetical protein
MYSLRSTADCCLHSPIIPRFGVRFIFPTVAREDRCSAKFHTIGTFTGPSTFGDETSVQLTREALD